MTVTSVSFDKRYNRKNGVVAEATIVLDGQFAVHKVLVINGRSGLFVAFPKYSTDVVDGVERHRDVAHPITEQLRRDIAECVLSQYMV